jgi:hypothetical protein
MAQERATGVINFYDLSAQTKFFSSSPLRMCAELEHGQIHCSSKKDGALRSILGTQASHLFLFRQL